MMVTRGWDGYIGSVLARAGSSPGDSRDWRVARKRMKLLRLMVLGVERLGGANLGRLLLTDGSFVWSCLWSISRDRIQTIVS